MSRALCGVLCISLSVGNSSVFGFGFVAHIGATKIAEKHLRPEVKAEVDRLIACVKDKLDASYQKADHTDRPIVKELGPLHDDFLRAALYLDLIRGKERKTASWHYVNVPLEADGYHERFDKERIHVVSRIEDIEKIVFDTSMSDAERGEALLWLIHLVEDVHVPLHVCSNHDRGGNSLKIQYYYPGKVITQSSNLHAVWDYLMLDVYSRDSEKCWAYIASFDTEEHVKDWSKGSVIDWANEGVVLAKRAYRQPGSERLIAQDGVLDSRYQQVFLPEMATCACKAGVRLAFVLNEGLKPKK